MLIQCYLCFCITYEAFGRFSNPLIYMELPPNMPVCCCGGSEDVYSVSYVCICFAHPSLQGTSVTLKWFAVECQNAKLAFCQFIHMHLEFGIWYKYLT